MKRILKYIIATLISISIICGMSFLYYHRATSPVKKQDSPITFTVTKGMGINELVDQLYEKQLIRNKKMTNIFLKLHHYPIIQANTYQLNQNMSVKQIMDIIADGDYEYVMKDYFTVSEGTTIPQVANVVASKLGISEDQVIAKWNDPTYLSQLIDQYEILTDEILNPDIKYPLEGYLYPDTYNVTGVDQSIEAYTKMMLDQMQNITIPLLPKIKEKNLTLHQFLTLASIVERESLYPEDKPKIAGVFENRLNNNMKLQSDITVLYALGVTKDIVTFDDLKVDSKYNTYLYSGLPVGPISNVYKETMEACLYPTKHDDYYFFADKDGHVYYSKTLEEHEKVSKEHAW